MPAQISDEFKYKGKKYSIVALENEWPFQLDDYEVRPMGIIRSDCWRGYFSKYTVKNDELQLLRLSIISVKPNPSVWMGAKA